MSQFMTSISAADRRVTDEYVERMRNEYERLEELEATRALIQSMDDPANYRNTQVVAAWDGESTLTESAYFTVRYREMSANGLTFWMSERPTTPFFVLVVDTPERTVKLNTRVIGVEADPSTDEDSFVIETEFEGTV